MGLRWQLIPRSIRHVNRTDRTIDTVQGQAQLDADRGNVVEFVPIGVTRPLICTTQRPQTHGNAYFISANQALFHIDL